MKKIETSNRMARSIVLTTRISFLGGESKSQLSARLNELLASRVREARKEEYRQLYGRLWLKHIRYRQFRKAYVQSPLHEEVSKSSSWIVRGVRGVQ